MNDAQVIEILVYIKVIILGLVSLAALIYTIPICFHRKLRTPLHLLSVNVSLTLFICALFWGIFLVMSTWFDNILWTEKSCLWILYLQTAVNCLSIYSTCVASLNRLLVIVYHTTVLFRTMRWILICIVVQWIIAILISLPTFTSSLEHCFISGLEIYQQLYVLFIVACLPSIFLSITNISIFLHVRRSTRRTYPARNEVNGTNSIVSQRDIRLLKHMIFMFSIFFCSWVPIYIIGVINWNGTGITYLAYHALQFLPAMGFVTNIIDLFLYNHELRAFLFQKFREHPVSMT
ncbi:unnamed protein product [Adineta ricciae]|uniref:G-protein coupled receptors family 1 profile domain-containing protein n=1 Tax=Adineta ricciae TaxID=249248 RepID=A0A815LEY8_ADIRI|nr:unnamed protein product [Adineta ricciae]CAF1530436.1 unnamed protein product [Adineta ricciae]